MSIPRRLGRIFRAEREDRRRTKNAPEDTLGALTDAIARQRGAVDDAQRAVGELAVHRRRVELTHQRSVAYVLSLEEQAALAVDVGDDEAARRALREQTGAVTMRDRLAAQLHTLQAQERTLRADLARLEDSVRETDLRRRTIQTDREAARASVRVRDALGAGGAEDPADSMRAAERELAEIRGRLEAREELDWTNPDSPKVRQAFELLEQETSLEGRLSELKAARRREGGNGDAGA